MTAATITDVRALVLESPEFGTGEADILREILANDSTAVGKLREAATVLLEKARHAAGEVVDVFPYRPGRRLRASPLPSSTAG